MRVISIYVLFSCSFLTGLSCSAIDGRTPENNMPQQPHLRFDVCDGSLWWNQTLKDRSRIDVVGMRTASLEGTHQVAIVHDNREFVMTCELISIVQYNPNLPKGYVRLGSVPASARDCCDWARQLCHVLGIPDVRIRDWCDAEVPPRRCLQNGSSDRWLHSIEIHTSFNKEKPWAITYTASVRQEGDTED